MNKDTGFGVTHFTIYADAACPDLNCTIDGKIHGEDSTPYLDKIYDLTFKVKKNIKLLYFR
jgi:hypothetical protein